MPPEFWMIEPEMAFYDLDADMGLAESNVKYLIRSLFETCGEELEFFNKFVDTGLIARLQHTLDKPFQRVSYTDAVDLLIKSGRKFEYPVEWGQNLQSEHERFLAESTSRARSPSSTIPARSNRSTCGRTTTVAPSPPWTSSYPASARSSSGAVSVKSASICLSRPWPPMKCQCEDTYRCYADLRRFGTVPHAGYSRQARAVS